MPRYVAKKSLAPLIMTGHPGSHVSRDEGYRSFWYKVVSIQVYSVEVQIVSGTGLNERRTFHPKCFFFHAQTILEVVKICLQFRCLSSYRKDERKDSKCEMKNASVLDTSLSSRLTENMEKSTYGDTYLSILSRRGKCIINGFFYFCTECR